MMYRIICLLIGYIAGCIQSAYFVGKAVGHIDIREYGSKNAGSTNINRVLGLKAGVATFICDILKTILAGIICRLIFRDCDVALVTLYAGLGVVFGHDWPFYLKFKGGKGVACTIASILVLTDWRVIGISYAIGIIVLIATKTVSICSMIFSMTLPILLFIFGYSAESIILVSILMVLIIVKHRSNIGRIIAGTESKLGDKKDRLGDGN